MKNSNLIDIFRTLGKKEVRELRKWVHSPAHNQREDVIALFEYLVTKGHLEEDKFLSKERVFRKIFPGEAYDDGKIRQTIHFLFKATEEFLIYQSLKENEVQVKLNLSSIYRRKGLNKLFLRTIQAAEQENEKSAIRDSNYIRQRFLQKQERYEYLSSQKRTFQSILRETSQSLDKAYLAEKLRQAVTMRSYQALFKEGYEMGLLDSVINYVEANNFQEEPAIGIYYYGYKASIEEQVSEHFENLKALIFEHGHCFVDNEKRDIYLMAINYCARKVNKGEREYMREVFDLQKRGIEEGIYTRNGELDRYTFRNIVSVGLQLREFQWLEGFIESHQHYLDPQHRENFVHFALSSLHFGKGEYDEARELLAHFEYKDVFINLQAKSMLIRMYYQEDEIDTLESLLDSMRSYMHRKKVSGSYQRMYSNLIRYTKKIIRLAPNDHQQREKLSREIQQAPMPERSWLQQMLETAYV